MGSADLAHCCLPPVTSPQVWGWGGCRFSTSPPSPVLATVTEVDDAEEEEVWNRALPSDPGWQLPLHRPEHHAANLL